MHYVRSYIFLLLAGLLFTTCSKDKFEAQVPSYVSIDAITLTTNYLTEGSASSNITDAWVFVNDDLVGVFELPTTFPIIQDGNVEIKVFAGIKNNGISDTRARYLMYDPYIAQVNLVKGETIKLNPEVSYNSDVKFKWMEDFENASLSFLYTTGSDTTVFKQSTIVKEGNNSGKVFLESTMDFFEATSIGYSDIPTSGLPVYLELDFITNEPVLIGIYHDSNQYALVNLNVTDDWRKIYIDLSSIVTAQPSSEIKIYMGIMDTDSNPFITSNPEIYLDNIKLIHY